MYSTDLRKKLLQLRNKGGSLVKLAREVGVSRSSQPRWTHREKEGRLAPQGSYYPTRSVRVREKSKEQLDGSIKKAGQCVISQSKETERSSPCNG